MDQSYGWCRGTVMLRVSEQLAGQAAAARDAFVGLARAFFGVISRSRANYWLAYVTDFTCAAVCYGLGLSADGTWPMALIGLLGGAFVFSFVEYAFHRWIFHAGLLVWSELHAAHHERPRNPSALPFWFSAVSAPVFFWLLTQIVSARVAHFAVCGFFAAYFSYGVLHHLQHSIRIKNVPFKWMRRIWAVHAVHHGRGDVNFGVTTSLWDRIFGTYRAPAKR